MSAAEQAGNYCGG